MVKSAKSANEKIVKYGVTSSWRTLDENLIVTLIEDAISIINHEERFHRTSMFRLGGAPGGDLVFTEAILRRSDPSKHLEGIYLPTDIGTYCSYFQQCVEEEKITEDQANMLTEQLNYIHYHYPWIIKDHTPFSEVNKDSYAWRDDKLIRGSDFLLTYQVNGSEGVQRNYEKALKLRIPTYPPKRFNIPETLENQSHKNIETILNRYNLPFIKPKKVIAKTT